MNRKTLLLLSRSYLRGILNRDGRRIVLGDSLSKRSGIHFPVRNVLTIIAVALVAVMAVALVAPYLIDWSAQRGAIEARLSAITGADVSLTGPVELRVLPTPYLALGEGLVSAPGSDGANLKFASARLELALVKLASGQIRFSGIRLEAPVLTLTRGPDGALKLPPLGMAGLRSTGFDRLSVRGGPVEDVRARARTETFRLQIDAAAPPPP